LAPPGDPGWDRAEITTGSALPFDRARTARQGAALRAVRMTMCVDTRATNSGVVVNNVVTVIGVGDDESWAAVVARLRRPIDGPGATAVTRPALDTRWRSSAT
jgi:hypothetical protein